MKPSIVVLSVIWGLITIGLVALLGSFTLLYAGKEIPEGLSVTVVASVVAALGAILSRTGHDNQQPAEQNPQPPVE
jgi:hypothetical protein